MNAIYTNQSTRENMDLLYAQARVYDRVKNWNRLNFLFSIIVPLLLSFVTVYNRSREFVDSELLSSLLGLYGLLVLTFNIVISGPSRLCAGRQPQSRKCTTAGYLASGVMN